MRARFQPIPLVRAFAFLLVDTDPILTIPGMVSLPIVLIFIATFSVNIINILLLMLILKCSLYFRTEGYFLFPPPSEHVPS